MVYQKGTTVMVDQFNTVGKYIVINIKRIVEKARMLPLDWCDDIKMNKHKMRNDELVLNDTVYKVVVAF